MTPEKNETQTKLKLSVVRDVSIVATLVVLGLYAGSAFLIPLSKVLMPAIS